MSLVVLSLLVVSAAPSDAVFVVDGAPGFGAVKTALAAYLDAQPHTAVAQHFCVVGYELKSTDASPPYKLAWVLWREGQRLILWEPAASDTEPKETLLHSRRDLDLRTDVVATEEQIAGSTYLITRPWLNELSRDCEKRGRQFSMSSK